LKIKPLTEKDRLALLKMVDKSVARAKECEDLFRIGQKRKFAILFVMFTRRLTQSQLREATSVNTPSRTEVLGSIL
jgi:hypothetical protein